MVGSRIRRSRCALRTGWGSKPGDRVPMRQLQRAPADFDAQRRLRSQGIVPVVRNWRDGCMDPRIQYLFAVAPTVLLLAVMVIGIVLGILQRRRQPWASRLVIPGLIALAANVVGSIAVRTYARHLSYNRYEDATVAAHHLAVLHSVLFALNYIGIALITTAVFADRGAIRVGRLTIGSSDRGVASSLSQGGDR